MLFSALAALLLTVFQSTSHEPTDGVLVARVIDGDTIELAGGELVRYIGVDAPETRRRIGARWIEDPEPFGREATEANRRWVEGRRVRLEYDVERRDRYGRLLAYVYVDGEMVPPPGASAKSGSSRVRDVAFGEAPGGGMVNAKLLEEGYAQLLTIPPNVKHADRFRQAQAAAREGRRGLWGR